MASTTFVDNTTVIQAAWCNDVNTSVYNVLGDGTNVPSTAAAARTNLGLGTIATQAASSVTITGGSVTGITDLAVADGGTGASTAANARTNLGAAASGAATASGLTMATSRLLGRTTASTGAIEEITVGSGLSLSAGTLSAQATSPTVFATTSGTSIDITTVPASARRITLVFNGVSTNGASEITVRGGSGSYETTGYTGATCSTPNATASTVNTWSTGATVISSTGAASLYYGVITFHLLGSNTWGIMGSLGRADALQISLGGSKTFSGTLDRLRLTTTGGTDTFDAGSISVMYE